jgi:uncharacterized protein (DUF1778 family)
MAVRPEPAQPRRDQRLEARVTGEEKQLFAMAASLMGRSLSDFVVGALREAAEVTIRENQTMRLTSADANAFVDALVNPPTANAALRQAIRQYLASTPPDAVV